jgi:hypothetical protein
MSRNIQGNYGKLHVFEDFLGGGIVNAAWTDTGLGHVGALAFTSVNEGSFAFTVDEPGGILAVTTDTGDNDNLALFAGVFKPADGGCVMEARFKVAVITTSSIFCGFSETLDAATPVMPLEFATATMSYNGSGNIAGLLHDADATTEDWRAGFGNAGAVIAAADAQGTRAYDPIVADRWQLVRVEIGADGDAWCYLNGKLIKHVKAAVTTTDVLYATLMVENRSGAANTMEVDYFYAGGAGRDWNDD